MPLKFFASSRDDITACPIIGMRVYLLKEDSHCRLKEVYKCIHLVYRSENNIITKQNIKIIINIWSFKALHNL